jgi:site-specific recombinase XerC
MTNEVISPLRRRMIEDMTIRRLSPKTQQSYIREIKNLAAFIGRSPDKASFEDVRRFQLHVARSGVGTGARNATVAALRFFFRVTLGRRDITEHTAFIHEPRKLPVVLSPDETARLLDAAPGLKYRAALSVAYGAGLRASEVVALKVSDIDSDRMLIRVEQGKGAKTATSCSLRICSICCAPGARQAGHRAGCFPARTGSILSPRASSIGPAMRPPTWRGSTSGYLRTRSGTALPPTCSSRTSTSA